MTPPRLVTGGSHARRALLALVLLAMASLAAACGGDGTAPPAGPSGIYDLVSVNDTSLPYTYFMSGFGGRSQIVGGSIEFRPQGRLLDIRAFRELSSSGSEVGSHVDTTAHAYTASANMVIIQRPMPYPPDSYADTAYIDTHGMRVHVRFMRTNFPGSYDFVYLKRSR